MQRSGDELKQAAAAVIEQTDQEDLRTMANAYASTLDAEIKKAGRCAVALLFSAWQWVLQAADVLADWTGIAHILLWRSGSSRCPTRDCPGARSLDWLRSRLDSFARRLYASAGC